MSNKQRYPSHLGATRQITAAHYLTEFMLIRHAENRSIKLPDKIWDKQKFSKSLQWKYWCGLYWGELKRATTLLKTYELNDILKALKEGEGKVILSLTNKKMRRLILDSKNVRELAEKVKEEVDLMVTTPDTLPRQPYGKKSKMGKLR